MSLNTVPYLDVYNVETDYQPLSVVSFMYMYILLYEGSIRAVFIQSVQVFTTRYMYLCSYVNTRILAVLDGEEVCCLSELGTQ